MRLLGLLMQDAERIELPFADKLALVRDVGLLWLRVGAAGLIWTFHMRPKLREFDHELGSFPDPLGIGHGPSFILALLSEGVCSLVVALGFAARAASLPIVFTMTMVLLLAVRGFAGADVQAALLYALPYSVILLVGPGKISVDFHLRGRYAALWTRVARRSRGR
jgi:putative oxidoreductase